MGIVNHTLQPVSRCPRCGYTLRYDRNGYRCDYCGYPNTREPMMARIRRFEHDMRSRVENFVQQERTQQYQRMVVQNPPYATRQRLCDSCRLRIPEGSQNCPYCGALQNITTPNPQQTLNTNAMQPGDQQVLDYIATHDGTISLSQAAQDLSLSPAALGSTIERLKAAGFLKPA